MNIGDRVKVPFAGKEKEGVVTKIFSKKAYLKVDFPRDPGKIVVRTIAELEGKNPGPKKKNNKKTKAKVKEKVQTPKERKDEEEKE